MGMLAEQADHVIGVDTHRDAHSAAAVATGTGAVVGADDDRGRRVRLQAAAALRAARRAAAGASGRSSPAAASAPG